MDAVAPCSCAMPKAVSISPSSRRLTRNVVHAEDKACMNGSRCEKSPPIWRLEWNEGSVSALPLSLLLVDPDQHVIAARV